ARAGGAVGNASVGQGGHRPRYLRHREGQADSGVAGLHEEDREDAGAGDRSGDEASGRTAMTRKFIPVEESFVEWRKDPEYVEEYEALEEEFALAKSLIEARSKANLTQEQVAERMHTSQSYVAKLEGGRINPTINALRRYAKATGTKLRFQFLRDGTR